MKKIYQEIWESAKPYYQKGRPTDLKHIEWMFKTAEVVCNEEDVDDTLLTPLVILHDVGYAEKNEAPDKDPFNQDLKKSHMIAGERISKKILADLSYPKDKTDKISYFVSVHDNWNLGDDQPFKNNKILAIFNDLDFIWLAVKEGFEAVRKLINKNPIEMINFIEENEKLKRRPFTTKTTEQIFNKYIKERKKENNIL